MTEMMFWYELNDQYCGMPEILVCALQLFHAVEIIITRETHRYPLSQIQKGAENMFTRIDAEGVGRITILQICQELYRIGFKIEVRIVPAMLLVTARLSRNGWGNRTTQPKRSNFEWCPVPSREKVCF